LLFHLVIEEICLSTVEQLASEAAAAGEPFDVLRRAKETCRKRRLRLDSAKKAPATVRSPGADREEAQSSVASGCLRTLASREWSMSHSAMGRWLACIGSRCRYCVPNSRFTEPAHAVDRETGAIRPSPTGQPMVRLCYGCPHSRPVRSRSQS